MNSIHQPAASYAARFMLWSALLLLLLPLARTGNAQTAVSDCKTGSRAAATGFWTWPPDSTVYVYVLQPDFSKEEIPLLKKPIELWDGVAQKTESKVRLAYAGTTLSSRDCENCLTITRGKIHNKNTRHAGEIRAFGLNGTRIIHHASIVIDPRMNTAESLASAVAHELGHSFGLQDCYNCKDRSTVMLKFSGLSASNGLSGPTACDVVQVRKAYAELKQRYRPPVVEEDEGEEGEVDDTPLVVPDP